MKNSLFAKTFVAIVVGLTLWVSLLYLTSVPFVNDLAFQIEEKAGRTILDNVYQLVRQGHQNLQAWQELALKSRKRELRNITLLSVSYIRSLQEDVAAGRMTLEQARQRAIDHIRKFQYGNHDYVWIANYDSVLISHPDPNLLNHDFSKIKDVNGKLIVPPMVEGARQHGEGFHTYSWNRLNDNKVIKKLTYFRNLPRWQWVIGTGVYIDDIEREVKQRKQEFIADLRMHLRHTSIAESGYIYIFDSDMNMIVHPNPQIENNKVDKLLDPSTGKVLANELIAASRKPDNEFRYKWDKPSDPGNYIYDKVSWIRYFPELGWYIVSSAYTSELERGGRQLAQRLLLMSLLALVLTIGAAWLFLRTLLTPIRKLAAAARHIRDGDLDINLHLKRNDELGVLSAALNLMVNKLKQHIDLLEKRVTERTTELSNGIKQLELRNHEIATFNAMSKWLLTCRNEEEAYRVLMQTAQKMFPSQSGQIFSLKDEDQHLEVMESWGEESTHNTYAFNDCLALRRGSLHYSNHTGGSLECLHLSADMHAPYLCAPITAAGEVMGLLHIAFTPRNDWLQQQSPSDLKRLAGSLAEQVALTINNLKLRAQLQRQSIRDPLTGLYNRRYLEESLPREEQRARRLDTSVGVIMLDVDHFKQVNDKYGHVIGDEVLKQLGALLKRNTRGEDIACRYGGEEFVIILPRSELDDAVKRAESIRTLVEEEIHVQYPGGSFGITISAGAAAFPECGTDLEFVLRAADNALYEAKEQGRNRVAAANVLHKG